MACQQVCKQVTEGKYYTKPHPTSFAHYSRDGALYINVNVLMFSFSCRQFTLRRVELTISLGCPISGWIYKKNALINCTRNITRKMVNHHWRGAWVSSTLHLECPHRHAAIRPARLLGLQGHGLSFTVKPWASQRTPCCPTVPHSLPCHTIVRLVPWFRK